MQLTIPLTGTVLVEGSLADGKLKGDNGDPIRPIDINLGNVSWTMVDVDLDNEVMIIEVLPPKEISVPKLDNEGEQKVDTDGNPAYTARKVTEQEEVVFLRYAQELVMNHTKDELYEMTGCSRLKRP